MTIPGLMLSGGRLSDFGGLKAVRQYRIWVHPKSGDDFYFAYSPALVAKRGGLVALAKHATAIRRKKKYTRVEDPIAVVWDTRYRKYREVVIDSKAR